LVVFTLIFVMLYEKQCMSIE